MTNVLLGVAAAAAGTGTVLFFFTDFGGRRDEQAEAVVGLGLHGRF